MAAKKRRKKPGLLWRVLFGHNGPTRAKVMAELERKLRLSLSSDFEVPVRDPATGRIRNQRWRIEPDGKVREVKSQPKKRPSAKKTTGRRTASKPSKPSRASKSGSAPRRRQPAATSPAMRSGHAAPMTERFLQSPDGTFNGSRSADPAKALRKAEQEYVKALRNANKAGRRAEHLLGWEQAPRR